MWEKAVSADRQELDSLCGAVRELASTGRYPEGEQMVLEAMQKYPNAAQPHNLLGILLEKQGDHLTAMKHFRAALDLDPAYLPAQLNLERYSAFVLDGTCAYDTSDCPKAKSGE